MGKDTRLSTALHVLFYLLQDKDKVWTSETIAGSVNTNPVVIRRLLGQLKAAGLVKVVSGKHGGYRMARCGTEITTLDVYRAVQDKPMFELNNNNPDENCPVGKNIGVCLEGFYNHLQSTLEEQMRNKTIAQLYGENSV